MFSATEKSEIVHIWRIVSEDFAVFNVDVTTEDPGAAALTKMDAADVSFGQRVCIGGSS